MARSRLTVAFVSIGLALILHFAPGPSSNVSYRFVLEPMPGSLVRRDGRRFVDSPAVLRSGDHFVWGGSVARAGHGRYVMFFSMFEAGPENPPFGDAWLLHSRIAWAVSDRPDRGFVTQGILLDGAAADGRDDAWDAHMVHNPHVRMFDGKPYLYYVGARDPGPQADGTPGAMLRRRDRIQQQQRIGVIASDTLDDLVAGRFERPREPLLVPRTRVKDGNVLDPSPPGTEPRPDNLVVVNPSVAFRPSDGKYLLYFKGNFYDPGWRGVHGVAIGDAPTGPFRALDAFVFDVRLPDGRLASAEDPYVWFHRESGRFHAVFKDFSGRITGSGPGLAMMTSEDGMAWHVPERPLFSALELQLEDGTRVPVAHLERPQLLVDAGGNPAAFYAACSLERAWPKTDGSTFNVQMRVRVATARCGDR